MCQVITRYYELRVQIILHNFAPITPAKLYKRVFHMHPASQQAWHGFELHISPSKVKCLKLKTMVTTAYQFINQQQDSRLFFWVESLNLQFFSFFIMLKAQSKRGTGWSKNVSQANTSLVVISRWSYLTMTSNDLPVFLWREKSWDQWSC